MSRYSISRQARRELKEIWQYIADDSPAAADRLLETFRKSSASSSRNLSQANVDRTWVIRNTACFRREAT